MGFNEGKVLIQFILIVPLHFKYCLNDLVNTLKNDTVDCFLPI